MAQPGFGQQAQQQINRLERMNRQLQDEVRNLRSELERMRNERHAETPRQTY